MLQFIQDIRTRVESMTEIKHFNIWNENNSAMSNRDGYPFKTPAIFLEFRNTEDAKQIGNTFRYDDFIVVFHILHEQIHDGKNFDQNLRIYDIRKALLIKFLNWTPPYTSGFKYKGEKPDYDHDNISEHLLMFTMIYEDETVADLDEGETQIVDPNSTVYYVNQLSQ